MLRHVGRHYPAHDSDGDLFKHSRTEMTQYLKVNGKIKNSDENHLHKIDITAP